MWDVVSDLLALLQNNFVKSLYSLAKYLWVFPLFAFLAFATFFLMDRRQHRRSLRGAIKEAFPARLYRHPSARLDMLNAVLYFTAWFPILATVGTIVVGLSVHDLLDQQFGSRSPMISAQWAVIPLHFLLIYLSFEISFYAVHYSFHKVPWLWSIHRLHHSAEALTVFATKRAHPLETLINVLALPTLGGIITGIVLYWLGTPLSPAANAAFVAYAGFYFPVLELLHHSHVWISYGKLNYVLSPPIVHQFHHSAEARHRDVNLGSTLTIFDWLFGTLYLPKTREEYRWGLNEDEFGENNPHLRVSDYYLEPVRHCWSTLRRHRRDRAEARATESATARS